MRCRQLLSLSVTLATVLVLVKCETPAKEKASGDQQAGALAKQEDKTVIDKHPTTLNTSSATEKTVTTPAATTETVKTTTYTTAPKKDGPHTTTASGSKTPTATVTKGDEKDTTTIKPTMQVTTTTANPQNSTSSALTALSAVTLCVLSLTVSL